jgi:hypothetical protein
MPVYYLHLAAIVCVQLAALFGAQWASGGSSRLGGRLLCLTLLGTGMGVIFERLMGAVWNVFVYPEVPQTVAFLLLNSLFSYGTALITAWLLPCRMGTHGSTWLRLLAAACLAAMIGAFVLLGLADTPQLVRVFAVGALTVTAAELCAVILGRIGPLLAVTRGQFSPLACLTLCSLVIGLIYEAGNYLFPLWRWNLGPAIPDWAAETLVIGFGYFVLIHPMLVLSRAVCGEPRPLTPGSETSAP